MVAVRDITKTGFYHARNNVVKPLSDRVRFPYVDFETPGEVDGNSPIHIPTYNNVSHLMVLDKNWVILVIDPMEELFDEIDTLSSGSFSTDWTDWMAGFPKPSGGDFTNRADMWATRDTYMGQARINIGERLLKNTDNYSITSSDDSNYSSGQEPNSADTVYVSSGFDVRRSYLGQANPDIRLGSTDQPSSGAFRLDYWIYCYLEFPTSMVDGDTYTITLDDGKSVTFLFSTSQTISRAIKVNQVGYLPDAGTKKAYIGAHLYEFGALDLSHTTTFDVVNADTGSAALSGNVVLAEANPQRNPQVETGTTTSTTANKLVDSGQNFTSTVFVGDRVYNTTDVTEADVTAVDSDTQLTLSSDIMTSGEGYEIRRLDANVDTNLMYGEDVYEMDFSSLTDTGTFYISVPGVGRSWPFKHSSDAYNEAYYTATRGLYHHRAGMALTQKYTHWPRPKAKMGPYYYQTEHVSFPHHDTDTPSGYEVFDACAYVLRYNPISQEPGGHHDAADWDCRDFHYTAIFDLLYAFQFNSNLADDQLNIPESGNGVPDVLSEARHGLEVWRISQNASGGVSGYLETWTHPGIYQDVGGGPDPFTKADYSYSQATRFGSLIFAAAAAQYARLVAPYDSADSTLYQTAAVNAYDFGTDAGNSLGSATINYIADSGTGSPGTYSWTELDSHHEPYLLHAKCQLWLLTGTDSYITDAPTVTTLDGSVQNPYVWQWERHDGFSDWIRYSIIECSNAGYTGLDSLASTWTTWFTADADDLIANLSKNPYETGYTRNSTPKRWGVSSTMGLNRSLAIAHQETGLAKYRNAMLQNNDFMLGGNPMGLSWTTGLGYCYPIYINNTMSNIDLIDDPIPGITIYGLSTDINYSLFRTQCWASLGAGDGAVTSITQTGGTATVTTVADHGLTTGDAIEIQGASESEYNVTGTATVTGAKTFTYAVDSGAASPATGTPLWYLDFTESSHRTPPDWRRWMSHPTQSVAQNEYTIMESIAPTLFSCAYFATGGISSQPEPRDPQYLWGRWYLV